MRSYEIIVGCFDAYLSNCRCIRFHVETPYMASLQNIKLISVKIRYE